MKIIFEEISVKNFLSYGNIPTVFNYSKGINVVTGKTLETGSRNGVGKSSILVDALSFVLYGKPLRGDHVNKDELVNELNKRNCEVHVKFTIGNNKYKVSRTIKPTTFIVYENETEIRLDSIKNTEMWLEDKLGMSHTCFSNILVLNMNNTQPFLSMDANKKRDIIENITNYRIYGKLADIAKDKFLESKNKLKVTENNVTNSKSNLTIAEDAYNTIQKEKDIFDENKKVSIVNIENKIKFLSNTIESLKNKISKEDINSKIISVEDKIKTLNDKINQLSSERSEVNTNLRHINDTLKLLTNTTQCPTCHTSTNNPVIVEFLEKNKIDKQNLESKIQEIITKNNSFLELKDRTEALKNKLRKEFTIQSDLLSDLTIKQNELELQQSLLLKEKEKVFTISKIISEDEIVKYKEIFNKNEIEHKLTQTEHSHASILRKILGEDGVRKYVLSKIIPYFNSKINAYLKILGSELSIQFNSSLEERILTRTREERTYSSFSGGEKKRIDISILLSLMDLAKLQNSIDTNLLILDEVLDTAMDNDGIENFLMHLKEGFRIHYPDKAVYIITHRNVINNDFYDSMIMIQKKDGFSTIEKIVDLKAI